MGQYINTRNKKYIKFIEFYSDFINNRDRVGHARIQNTYIIFFKVLLLISIILI